MVNKVLYKLIENLKIAGTRYKRRGVDVDGNVANYVETEQILLYHHYALSFLQVRGSVPVFW